MFVFVSFLFFSSCSVKPSVKSEIIHQKRKKRRKWPIPLLLLLLFLGSARATIFPTKTAT
jgi:hypothetical protein